MLVGFFVLTFLTNNVDSPLEIGQKLLVNNDFDNTTHELSWEDQIIAKYFEEKRNRENQIRIDVEKELQKKLKLEAAKKEAEFFRMIQAKILVSIQHDSNFIISDGSTTIRVNSRIRETNKIYDLR